MLRSHEKTPREAPRGLVDGAPRWGWERAPSQALCPPMEEEPIPSEEATPWEAPAPSIAHFTRALWAERSGSRVVELLRGLSPQHSLQVGVLEEEGPLRDTVTRLGVRPVTFQAPAGARPSNLGPRIDAVEAWLRGASVEVVHVHDAPSALIAIPAALRAGCRVVLERSEPEPWSDRSRRAALRWLTRKVERVVVDSEAARRRLARDEGLDAERIAVIRPGFDFGPFTSALRAGPQRPLPSTGGAPVVVLVASMEDEARCEEDVLGALGLARRRLPGLRAFVVGEGPRRAELEQRARALGLSEAVDFLGWRPDVPAVLARATVAVHCPRGEGLSRSVLEGMAAGLPLLVVSDADGPAELLAEGARGVAVPAGEPDALADALAQVLEDPAGARRMGVNARAFVARELTLARMVAGYEALYRQA